MPFPWSLLVVLIIIIIAYKYVTKPFAPEPFNARPCISSELCKKMENPEGVIDPSWRTYFPGGYGGSGINLYAFKTPQSDQLTSVDVSDAAHGRDLHYADWMRYLEFEAQKKIAGCNSPPDITMLLWG